MPNTVTVYLPTSRDVVVKGLTNAWYLQRITLDIEGVGQLVISGSGENNHIAGIQHFTTPSGGGGDDQITVGVTIEYSSDGGASWSTPDIYLNTCTVQAYNLVVIVAEDMADQDYNDAVCMISWPGRDNALPAAAAVHADF